MISKTTYISRQLVDAETGKPTPLMGEALVAAKATKTVISKGAYAHRQLVDAETGEPTPLMGDALAATKATKTVISKNAFAKRSFEKREAKEGVGDDSSQFGGSPLARKGQNKRLHFFNTPNESAPAPGQQDLAHAVTSAPSTSDEHSFYYARSKSSKHKRDLDTEQDAAGEKERNSQADYSPTGKTDKRLRLFSTAAAEQVSTPMLVVDETVAEAALLIVRLGMK